MSEQRISNSVHRSVADDLRAEIARLTASYEARLADANQAVGALIYAVGLTDNPDCTRLQDILAYGKTEDGTDLLPWPRDPEALARDSDVVRLTAERDEARVECDNRRDFMMSEGYRECDTAACNCNSWHGGHFYRRFSEIRDLLEGKGWKQSGEQILDALRSLGERADRHDALLAERAGVSEAMKLARREIVILAESGVNRLRDFGHEVDDPERTYGPILAGIEAALSTPIPAPVDRDAIRAEAFEEAAEITKTAPSLYAVAVACLTRAVELRRPAAKTETSR